MEIPIESLCHLHNADLQLGGMIITDREMLPAGGEMFTVSVKVFRKDKNTADEIEALRYKLASVERLMKSIERGYWAEKEAKEAAAKKKREQKKREQEKKEKSPTATETIPVDGSQDSVTVVPDN